MNNEQYIPNPSTQVHNVHVNSQCII